MARYIDKPTYEKLLVCPRKLRDFSALYWAPWPRCGPSLTADEILEAPLVPEPFYMCPGWGASYGMRRTRHAGRVRYFIENPDAMHSRPILLRFPPDLKIPPETQYHSVILDGYHRLTAAVFSGTPYLLALCSNIYFGRLRADYEIDWPEVTSEIMKNPHIKPTANGYLFVRSSMTFEGEPYWVDLALLQRHTRAGTSPIVKHQAARKIAEYVTELKHLAARRRQEAHENLA